MKKLSSIYLPRSSHSEVMMDINTTPLIDVMLVLLIMFIITIPRPVHSIDMDITSGQHHVVTQPHVVKIEIDANNVLMADGQIIPERNSLINFLQILVAQNPDTEVSIKSHKQTKYKSVADAMAAARNAGIQKIGVFESSQ